MRRLSILTLFLALALLMAPGCRESRVVLGDERFDEYLSLLEGRRVAILSNQSGIVGDVVDGKPCRREVDEASVDEPFLPFKLQ